MDNYGMAANDAMIKTKALEMGIYDGTGQMDLATKQAATLALIMEQSGAAQGQAAREAEGASGAMRAFVTEIKNLTTSFGEILLPVLTPFLAKINEIVQKLSEMSSETKKVIVVIAGLAAAIGPLLIIIGQMSLGISGIIGVVAKLTPILVGATGATGGLSAVIAALTGPIGIAIAAIVAITAIIVTLWKTNEDFRDGMKRVWENIKQIIDGAIQIIKGVIQAFTGLITGDWTKFTEGLKTIWSGMWQAIRNIVSGAWNLLSTAFSALKSSIANFFTGMARDALGWGRNLISGFIDGIKSMLGAVGNAVSGVVGNVKDFIGFSSPTKKGEGRHIVDWGYNMIDGFIDGMKKAMPALESSLNAAIPNMVGTGSTLNTSNSFVVNAVIREEQDISKVAQEFYRLQQQNSRGRGIR